MHGGLLSQEQLDALPARARLVATSATTQWLSGDRFLIQHAAPRIDAREREFDLAADLPRAQRLAAFERIWKERKGASNPLVDLATMNREAFAVRYESSVNIVRLTVAMVTADLEHARSGRWPPPPESVEAKHGEDGSLVLRVGDPAGGPTSHAVTVTFASP